MNHQEIRAILDGRLDDSCKIFPQPYLSTGEIDPIKFIRSSEELSDLIQCQLMFRFPLPNVTGLALIITPVRHTERKLVWETEPADI
jgi:hypothetical protein